MRGGCFGSLPELDSLAMPDRPAPRRRRPRSSADRPAETFTNLNKPTPGLTAKQARFVEEFCVDFNATQAAIRAGYAKASAPAAASRLRAHPAVAAAVLMPEVKRLALQGGATVRSFAQVSSSPTS